MQSKLNLKMKDKLIASFVMVFIILMAYLWFSPSGLNAVPKLELTTITGEKIKLESLRGQPMLITFWATSCSGCVKEMPHLIDLNNTYAPRGLRIIGISMPYDRPDHVMEMARQKKLPYSIAMDINKEAVKAFGDVSLTPTTFLVSSNGVIVRKKIGEFNVQKFKKHIELLLAPAPQNMQPVNAVKKLI